MAQLSADKVRGYELGDFNDLPVLAATTLYMGSAVGISSGYARPLVALDKFAGFVNERVDNAAGANGAKLVNVRHRGEVEAPVVGVTGNGDIGSKVYASDGDTFTLTSTGNTLIGVVHRHVSGTTCVFKFDIAYQGL